MKDKEITIKLNIDKIIGLLDEGIIEKFDAIMYLNQFDKKDFIEHLLSDEEEDLSSKDIEDIDDEEDEDEVIDVQPEEKETKKQEKSQEVYDDDEDDILD